MNLYRIKNKIGTFYSVAEDYGKAQHNVEEFLNKEDYGFIGHRHVSNIELIATSDLSDSFETLVTKNK